MFRLKLLTFSLINSFSLILTLSTKLFVVGYFILFIYFLINYWSVVKIVIITAVLIYRHAINLYDKNYLNCYLFI